MGQETLFQPEVLDRVGRDGIEELRRRCSACTRCELSKGRTNAVLGEGKVDQPLVAFIGEAPGADEDTSGRPFVGRAGKLLDKMIEAMGLKREDVWIGNACCCRPPDNRTPEQSELDACHEFLVGQLRAVRPDVIVTLGASATRAVTKSKKKISDLRGKWLEWEGVPVMPTFHPSYLMRGVDPESKRQAWSDLQTVMARVGLRITR